MSFFQLPRSKQRVILLLLGPLVLGLGLRVLFWLFGVEMTDATRGVYQFIGVFLSAACWGVAFCMVIEHPSILGDPDA